jgi:hypothetical protein
MKMNKNIVLAGICLMIAMASCKKYETFPVDKVTLQYVFNPLDSAGTNAQKYLLGVYQVLKNGHNRVGGDYLDAASDDAISSAVYKLLNFQLPAILHSIYPTTKTFGRRPTLPIRTIIGQVYGRQQSLLIT